MADPREKFFTKLAGTFLVVSGIIFFIFNTLAEAYYPNYSVKANALSDLGALGAPTILLWDGQLFATGLLAFLGMYLLFLKSSWSTRIKRRNATAILFLLPPLTTIIVSLFPENFIGAIHLSAAIMTFTLGGISAIYAYRLTRPPFKYISIILGVISFGSANSLGAQALFGLD